MRPSLVHEARVGLLGQLGRLAGCTVPSSLGRGLDPDVLLSHPNFRLVFLGEAKRSETPGNADTARRLRRYLRALRHLQRNGYAARMVLCGDPLEAERWFRALSLLAMSERLAVSATGMTDVDLGERLVWLDLSPTGASRLPASLRSSLQPA